VAGPRKHTNGGGLNHVPDGESLNRFILWCASRAVGTADGLDVAATLLVSAAVSQISLSFAENRLRMTIL
jgi:hypothetical protein